jgi:ABC-2 type transport system ATP-binding protein
MQDVQELCDRVVVIDHGSLVFEGTLDQLSERFSDTRRVVLTFSESVLAADLERYGKVIGEVGDTATIQVPRAKTAQATSAMLQALPVSDVAIEEVAMDDIIRDLFTRKEGS